jgi:hypothetical protein
MATRTICHALEELPTEMLQQIAGYLHGTPSLLSFSLASKTCHHAALPLSFRNIYLTVSNRESLQLDVDTLIEILSRSNSARHVRFLAIKGFLRGVMSSALEAQEARIWYGEDSSRAALEKSGDSEIFDGEEPVFGLGMWYVCTGSVIKKHSEEDEAWAPVINLINGLPGLTTLEYNCHNQFPPTLLDAIQDHKCKLHHMTFRMRSLLEHTPDLYEMALATSPCLYKAKIRWNHRDSKGDDDFNHEAIMELAAGLAPNLREVIVEAFRPPISSALQRPPRGPWRGLPGFFPGKNTGSLTSLIFQDQWMASCTTIKAWAEHTDFKCLRHLGLGGIGIDTEVMELMVENFSFPRLRTLQVVLARKHRVGGDETQSPGYADAACRLIRLFEPLQRLSIKGPLEPQILNTILSRHGPTVQELALRPEEYEDAGYPNPLRRQILPMTFEKKHILQIQSQCPVLRKLSVTTKRTKSDAVEAELYKSFCKLESLQSLFLTLDCSDWRVVRDPTRQDDPSFDAFDREMLDMWGDNWCVQKGHLRDSFMNCAVDEKLARSIWETICRDKKGRPLQSLKLWTTGGGHWGGHSRISTSHWATTRQLSRSWLIERRKNRDGIDVRELGREGREADDRSNGDWDSKEVQQVFRRIWPHKKENSKCCDDWESLPLKA